MEGDFGEDEESEPTNTWDDVYVPAEMEPVRGGVCLAARFAIAPPLEALGKHTKDATRFSGIPKTPAPRRNQKDRTLHKVQRKLENAIHALTENACNKDDSTMWELNAAGLIRSAWQDLHEERRALLVKQPWKLDDRPDKTDVRLLAPHEEKLPKRNMKGGKGGKGRNTYQPQNAQPSTNTNPNPNYKGNNYNPNHWRDKTRERSKSRSSGKGKDKGLK